ncbi:hypothetical protein [Chryseobacterium turcicum]|uniref:YD repeat-containing protein n=1 Tax=Chryseobacterium turcicum TaxID=2898076 RepID=A0A9Q3V343_9FLAO|nr:hypothetical protein [Chryseobacterium turcicum]MCD1117457.1 hypothetical protein [Chryseobacterium turcicum]
MIKIFNNFLFVVISIGLFTTTKGQSNVKNYVEDVNKIYPAAPTSNNLMKFEEVPVSNYTGIPDISIPLVSIPSTNPNVNINIGLKYHPLNTKSEDRSGETGLGWSLMAGGTITRTVRGGGPDEKNKTIPFGFNYKLGIYNHVLNPTYKIISGETALFEGNILDNNEYAFYAVKGRYDTEYDLYQYNFMGISGRFYIVKNNDGSFTVEKLDRNNVQIICHKDVVSGELDAFTIIDDKGIKYSFNGMERIHREFNTIKIGLTTSFGYTSSQIEGSDYFSAYHLVKIMDQADSDLVTFTYDLFSNVKFQETPTFINRIASDVSYQNLTSEVTGDYIEVDEVMPGAIETQHTFNTSHTKLLTQINIIGKGNIKLNYEVGRQDSNYTEPNNLYKLKSIQTNYLGQDPIKFTEKYNFEYDYSDTNFLERTDLSPIILKRMLLDKVIRVTENNQNTEYKIEYNRFSGIELKKDKWGYFLDSGLNYVAQDVVKSITYPTNGKVAFDFEANEYSYFPGSGNGLLQQVEGYFRPEYDGHSIHFGNFNPNIKKEFFTVISPQKVSLKLMLGNLIYCNWKLNIYKKISDNQYSPVVYNYEMSSQMCRRTTPPFCPNDNTNPDQEIISEINLNIDFEPGVYYASLTGDFAFSSPIANTIDTFEATTVENVFVDTKKEKGGGLRINNISYFENSTSDIFTKKYTYNYDDINDPQRSSGALVFPVPIFNYSVQYDYIDQPVYQKIHYNAHLNVTTNYNILPVMKTQGADVGYKFISIQLLDKDGNSKGKSLYNYRSPIDFRNTGALLIDMPIIPIPDQDYLRGQLIWEKTTDENNRLLAETEIIYNTKDALKVSGIKLRETSFSNMINHCYSLQNYTPIVINCKYVTIYKNTEKFGITLPIQKKDKSYFYKNNIPDIVSTITNYTYNTRDYITATTQIFADGTINASESQYAHEKGNTRLINANIIGTPLETSIVKKQNITDPGKVLSKIETKYDNPSNLFPSSVLSYDFNNIAQTEVTYDQYDSKGNLVQYTTKDGIPTTIIWGYNSTQPIAKIVGYPYALVNGLATDIITASDADALNPSNETALITALDNFRHLLQLKEFQITTYTYDPLIGVTSITPPSGIKEVYLYDSANRLKEIKQQEKNTAGNLIYKTVKEFKYNYKH